jgi:competence protein ComEA
MKIVRGFLFGLLLAASCVSLQAAPVDINHASAEEIAQSLSGIGQAKADAIVAYRNEHGTFASADELTLVKGVGNKTVEKNRSDIMVENE